MPDKKEEQADCLVSNNCSPPSRGKYIAKFRFLVILFLRS